MLCIGSLRRHTYGMLVEDASKAEKATLYGLRQLNLEIPKSTKRRHIRLTKAPTTFELGA